MKTELTELEICKKAYQICGLKSTHDGDIEWYEESLHIECDDSNFQSYRSPLRDDSLCFNLMLKQGIVLSRIGDFYIAKKQTGTSFSKSESPNKAICLEIIRSNNDR